MTKPIEQEFYNAFNIKPIALDYPDNTEYYHEITDRILLELMSNWNEVVGREYTTCLILAGRTIEKLKVEVLGECLDYKENLYESVRKIMGVENE